MNLPEKIQLLRKEKGETQKDLADILNIGVSTLKTYENDPCLVSDHLYYTMSSFIKSLYEKEQILHRGKTQQALTDLAYPTANTHRKMCSTNRT